MQRISTPSASSDHKFLPGDGGTFRGTQFSAAWCNAVQEEIAGFIESAGLELDDDDNNQLFAAFSAMLAAGFSVSGNIDFIGQGGSVSIDNGGVNISWGEGSAAHAIRINGNGMYFDGVQISKTMKSGVPVLEIDKTLELLSTLVVDSTASFKGNSKFDGWADFKNYCSIRHLVSYDCEHGGEVVYQAGDGTQSAYEAEVSSGNRIGYYKIGNFQQGAQQYGGYTAFKLDRVAEPNVTKCEIIIVDLDTAVTDCEVRNNDGSAICTMHPGDVCQFIFTGSKWKHLS